MEDASVCYSLHRVLAIEARALARALSRPLPSVRDNLRLAAACVELGASRAFSAQSDQDAARGWRDAALGDRRIRGATYDALAQSAITHADFDRVFAAAVAADRARQEELLALRHRLLRQTFV
jgi:hypothetical protein